jgi:hypothetical protein
MFVWLVPDTVAGHHDDERSRFTGVDQCIGGLIRSQAVPLVIVIALPV